MQTTRFIPVGNAAGLRASMHPTAAVLCEGISNVIGRNSGKLPPHLLETLSSAKKILVAPGVENTAFKKVGGILSCAALHEEPDDLARVARKIDLTHRLGMLATQAYWESGDRKGAATAMLSFAISIHDRVMEYRGALSPSNAAIEFIAQAAEFLTDQKYPDAGRYISEMYTRARDRSHYTGRFLEAAKTGDFIYLRSLLHADDYILSATNLRAVGIDRRTALMDIVDKGSVEGTDHMLRLLRKNGMPENERLAYVNYASDAGYMNALYLTGGVLRTGANYKKIAEMLVAEGAMPGMPRVKAMEHREC